MRYATLLVALATVAVALPTEDCKLTVSAATIQAGKEKHMANALSTNLVANRSFASASAAAKSFCAANPDHFKCVNDFDV